MKKIRAVVTAIYLVCTFLFFFSVSGDLQNAEEAFKNIYWYIFYLILYFMFVQRTPDLIMVMNRYRNSDRFLFRSLAHMAAADLAFCLITCVIKFLALTFSALSFSGVNLLLHTFHLFFLLLNFSFFVILIETAFSQKYRWLALTVYLSLYLIDLLFINAGPLRYLLLTAGYLMTPSVSIHYALIQYGAYLILGYLLYQLIVWKRKDIQ